MQANSVHIEGTVKRDASMEQPRAAVKMLDFCLVVPSDYQDVYVDCLAAGEAVDMLDGYVKAGERVTIDGHLTYRTYTGTNGRRRTGIVVYVENAYAEED